MIRSSRVLSLFLLSWPVPALFAQAPTLPANGIVNAADYTGDIAPGTLIALFGQRLAARTVQASGFPLPTTLDGVTVEITDGGTVRNAPLFFVSSGQINAQLPFDITSTTVQVRVRNSYGTSSAAMLTVLSSAPHLFTRTLDGKGEAILLHADYTLVSASNPARPSEVVILYLTGLGQVSPAVAAGTAAGDGSAAAPLNRVSGSVAVTVGGQPAQVLFAGLAPYFAGLYQLNVQLPATLPSGSLGVYVTDGQRPSQDGVAAAVQSTMQEVASASLGAAGGTVSASGFRLQVPQGAVTTATSVHLFRQPAETGMATDAYILTGMPASTQAPLSVTLDLPKTPDGETFVAVRVPDNLNTAPALLRATVQNGKATVTLPAYDAAAVSSQLAFSTAAATAQGNYYSPVYMFWALEGYGVVFSPSSMFLVSFPRDPAWESKATRIAAALDAAYTKLNSVVRPGFTKRRGENFPIVVHMRQFSDSSITGHYQDRWGMEGDLAFGAQKQDMHLNIRFMQTEDQMKLMFVTAAHELFHLLQNLYDPRDGMQMKLGMDTPWLWYEEAASTWFERVTPAGGADYLPTTIKPDSTKPESSSDNYSFVLSGLASPNTQEHGYGASMFLEHLAAVKGQTAVGDILRTMQTGTKWPLYTPLEAITSYLGFGAISGEWRAFCRKYMAGTVYGSPGGKPFPGPSEIQAVSEQNRWWVPSGAADTGKSFRWSAPPLSAAVYALWFSQSNFKSGTKLAINASGLSNLTEMIVYRASANSWTKVAENVTSYEVPDAAQLKPNGETLWVMLVNAGEIAQNVTLDIAAGDLFIPKLNSVKLSLTSSGTGLLCGHNGGTPAPCANPNYILVSNQQEYFANYKMAGAPLVWSGNSFSIATGKVLYYRSSDAPVTYEANISGVVDPVSRRISSISGTMSMVAIGSGGAPNGWKMEILTKIAANNLNFLNCANGDTTCFFQLDNDDARKNLAAAEYSQTYTTWTNNVPLVDRIVYTGNNPSLPLQIRVEFQSYKYQ